MAVGDAAGLVDPVTGEGLYYAIRSGDLAAEARARTKTRGAGGAAPARIAQRLQRDFVEDLAYRLAAWPSASSCRRFLCSSVAARMIEFMRHSPRLRDIVQDLFAGTQGYLDLKERTSEEPERHHARDRRELAC